LGAWHDSDGRGGDPARRLRLPREAARHRSGAAHAAQCAPACGARDRERAAARRGARAARDRRFEQGDQTGDRAHREGGADGGALFLDEIGDMSLAAQAKVLRALEDGVISRVGSEKTLPVDVRVIAATNKTLTAEIAAGRFREDLLYRLNVVPIDVPPLRAR